MKYTSLKSSVTALELADFSVAGGFPNPCEDHLSNSISLDDLLIKRPSSTFLFRVSGCSMSPDITDGTIIVVDRSVTAKSGRIVVATIDNEFVVKELDIKDTTARFISRNPEHKTIEVTLDPDNDWESNIIWGVVTGLVKIF